jgi:hypothetical protein
MKKLRYIAMFDGNHRNSQDERKREAWIVGAYFDEKGDEYRKAFTFPRGTPETEAVRKIPEIIN